MLNGKHSYLMIGLAAAGALLVLSGNAGGALSLLWPVLCMAMMAWMMWAMRGTGRGTGRGAAGPADHTHVDGRTHAHE